MSRWHLGLVDTVLHLWDDISKKNPNRLKIRRYNFEAANGISTKFGDQIYIVSWDWVIQHFHKDTL